MPNDLNYIKLNQRAIRESVRNNLTQRAQTIIRNLDNTVSRNLQEATRVSKQSDRKTPDAPLLFTREDLTELLTTWVEHSGPNYDENYDNDVHRPEDTLSESTGKNVIANVRGSSKNILGEMLALIESDESAEGYEDDEDEILEEESAADDEDEEDDADADEDEDDKAPKTVRESFIEHTKLRLTEKSLLAVFGTAEHMFSESKTDVDTLFSSIHKNVITERKRVNRVRDGKIQKNKIVTDRDGYKVNSDGIVVRMDPSEVKARKKGARKAARKRKITQNSINRKRARSMRIRDNVSNI